MAVQEFPGTRQLEEALRNLEMAVHNRLYLPNFLQKVRDALPPALKEAEQIRAERGQIIGDAQVEAGEIIRAAKAKAEQLISERGLLEEAQKRFNYVAPEVSDIIRDIAALRIAVNQGNDVRARELRDSTSRRLRALRRKISPPAKKGRMR